MTFVDILPAGRTTRFEEPIHEKEDFNPAVYCKVKLTQSVCCLETSDVVIPTEFNA